MNLQEKIHYDFEWYARNFLQIRNYDEPTLIPFRLNEPQKIIYKKILEAKAAKKPIRHIILKARKEGVTTLYNAYMYWKCATNKLTDAMIVAHDADTSTVIFDKIRIFYDSSPEFVQPMRKARSRRELRFENPTQKEDEKREDPGLLSSFNVGTSGSKELGRGGTYSLFHGSEVAFWGKNAKSQMLGLINSIPDHDPRTMVVLESTANGPSGYFYDQVLKAQAGEGPFELIFLPWHLFDRYKMETHNFEIRDEHEEQLHIKGITDQQLEWRRWCIQNKCDGSINMFRQEYPSTEEEAFIHTGRSAFSQEKLLVFLQNAPTDPPLYSLEDELIEDPEGEIKIFQHPEEGVEYLMGCDVSEGIDLAEDAANPDTDYTWVNVSRRDNMKQVLSWRTKIDPDLLGPALEMIGHYYNTAWINVENNNHGIVPCIYLKNNYPLHRLYMTIRVDHIDDKYTELVGFRTTSSSKAYLVSEGKKAIRDGECWIFDRAMIKELMAYKQDARGRYSGGTTHDDGTIAFLLTNIVRIYSYEHKKAEEPEFDWSRIRDYDPALRIRKRKKKHFWLGDHRRGN